MSDVEIYRTRPALYDPEDPISCRKTIENIYYNGWMLTGKFPAILGLPASLYRHACDFLHHQMGRIRLEVKLDRDHPTDAFAGFPGGPVLRTPLLDKNRLRQLQKEIDTSYDIYRNPDNTDRE